MSNYSVGDKIITPAKKVGVVSSVHSKITITWENGLSGEYTPKQLQAWNYQKFLEDTSTGSVTKEAIASCQQDLHNLTSAQELVQDSAMQDSSVDLNLLEPQTLTITAQASSNSDTQKCITTAMSEALQNKSELSDRHSLGENLTSSQLPHPAPHSPQKDSDSEQTTSETVSPQFSKLSENCNPNSPPSKTLQDCLPAPTGQIQNISIFHTYSDSLPSAGTMRNGLLSAVDTLPAPSLEKDYCWLRSPGALSSTGKGRPPGQTKQEAELKQLGLINKGEVLSPAILCQWYEIPETWLDPSESRAATELLEECGRQQEIFSIQELPPLPLSASSTLISCPACQQELLNLNDGCGVCGWEPSKSIERTQQKVGAAASADLNFSRQQLQVDERTETFEQGNGVSELTPVNFLEDKRKSEEQLASAVSANIECTQQLQVSYHFNEDDFHKLAAELIGGRQVSQSFRNHLIEFLHEAYGVRASRLTPDLECFVNAQANTYSFQRKSEVNNIAGSIQLCPVRSRKASDGTRTVVTEVPGCRAIRFFECKTLYDSGAFPEVMADARVTPEVSLNRQLTTLAQLPNFKEVLLVSYDRLIDEKHINGQRVKQRWTVEEGELGDF